MIGTELSVTTTHGTYTAVATARSIVDTEQRFNRGALALFTVEARLEGMWFLAWDSLRLAGVDVGDFDAFIDCLVDVSVADEPLPPPPPPPPKT